MKKNMGTMDRVIRIIVAVFISLLYFTGQISGTLAAILGIVALVLVITSFIGYCPAYTPLGISTKKK